MQKYFGLSKLLNIIPEAIALLIVLSQTHSAGLFYICSLLLFYAVILRFIWNSAIMVHGFGHSVAIAWLDRDLSALNLTNILEARSVTDILRSLFPGRSIFIPLLSSSPHLSIGKPERIRLKALAGILFNLLVVLIASGYIDNLFTQAVIVANLIIACSSISDVEAFVTGIAEHLYCGNFGLIAQRQADDGQELLPDRLREIALQMGQETEVRGEQAGGGLVIAKNNDFTVFVGKKVVNRKRSNLTQSLEAAFAPIRNKAIAAGIKPLPSVIGAWHYRYATSGSAPSPLETHWHEWMSGREQQVWRFTGTEWQCESKNVHHRITHNGDFDSWKLFNRDVDNCALGLWLERVLHTPNATKGDSPKIAGMMDLLVTQGIWLASVRWAYQKAIATAVEDAFQGQKPTADAPNTAPDSYYLNVWANIFESAFTAELASLRPCDAERIAPRVLESSSTLRQAIAQALSQHTSTQGWSKLQTISFIQSTLQAFFYNDLYRATQIFIERAKGSFGLVTVSTLEESELVLCAKGQPISVGFNWSEDYMVYASEPAAVDRILLNQPRSFRLDLDPGGEVAKVSAKNIAIYSLLQQQELQVLQLQHRWVSMTTHPHLNRIKLSQTGADPVAQDIDSIPQILHEIKTDWENPTSLNCLSAKYLIYLFEEKVKRFETRQQLMFKAGLLSKIREMPAIDLLITGEENSLWLGEKFARDLKTVFPLLNIVVTSANEILQQLDRGFGQLNLGKDSLVLAITQSGQTFSTVQIIKVFDNLSSQGIIGELFIMTGEISSFINETQGKGGLTTITNSSFLDNEHHRRYRIFINGSGRRTAEPTTVTVAAAGQTLTELLFYLAKQMRINFPNSNPLGLSLSTESLMVLAMMKEDFLNKNVLQIVGTTASQEALNSPIHKTLVRGGQHWAGHVTETPLAWAIHALYIFISVGWAIPFGYTLSLAKTLSALLFYLFNLPTTVVRLLTPIVTLADIAIYIFGVWLWTLAIRYIQHRQLFARMGKRTLVIGDVPWVNQLLQAYVSKLFSLSYGIATIEVHSANPQNHLLHNFGHRVVRGTLIWLGIPDGRRSQQQQAAEQAVIMTGKQAKGVRNFNIGAEILAIGNNPAIAKDFSKFLVLDSNKDEIYFRNSAVIEQKEAIEQLRESCFGSFERLLAGYVFFWALAKKVASFPFLKYEYWKSQSRTKVMTTAAPVEGFDLNKLRREKMQREANLKKYAQKSDGV